MRTPVTEKRRYLNVLSAAVVDKGKDRPTAHRLRVMPGMM